MQAYRIRESLLFDIEGHESNCFALFPDYIRRLQASDNENKALLELDPEDGAFVACAIAPASTRNALKHTRSIIALDATHTKSRYRMMILIATTIDANGNLLPFAWALVPTENVKWWVWFCTFLKEHFNTLDSHNLIVLSDREKGISDGVNQLFPNATQHHCCQHLAANVQATYGLAARNQFWKIARANTQKLFMVYTLFLFI